MKKLPLYYVEKYGPYCLLLFASLCFYSAIFPAITTQYLYHNDVYYLVGDVFSEIPHLLAIGRPLGALLLHFQSSFINSPEDLVFSRQVTAILIPLLSFATFHHLHKSWNTPPLVAAGIAAISFFLPSTILNVLWASQLPPNVAGAFLGLASSYALVAALPANRLVATNSALQQFVNDTVRYPSGVLYALRNLFYSMNRKWIIFSVLLALAGMLIYPLSTLYVFTFAISGLLFSSEKPEIFKNIVRTKIIVIVFMFLFIAVYITGNFLSIFFESFSSNRYNYNPNLNVAAWIGVVADLWLVIASTFVFPSSFEAAIFFSLLLSVVPAAQAMKRSQAVRAVPVKNRRDVAVFLLIAAALAMQSVMIVFGIRIPFHTNPDEYVMYRMTYSLSMSFSVLLLYSMWRGYGMLKLGRGLLFNVAIVSSISFILVLSSSNYGGVVRNFVDRESAILDEANKISAKVSENGLHRESAEKTASLDRLLEKEWPKMDRDYSEKAIFILQYVHGVE